MALKEYFSTDSNKSIMRLTFFMTVTTGLIIATASAAAGVIGAFYEKTVDLSVISNIVGLLIGGSFLGKAAQTFGEAFESKKVE